MYFLNNIPALVNDLFRDFNEEHRTEPDLRILYSDSCTEKPNLTVTKFDRLCRD